MAERPKLVEVDENYTPPATATPEQRAKGQAAALIKEGRRRANADSALTRARTEAAHAAALQATETAYDKALAKQERSQRAIGYHRAAWQFGIGGTAFGLILACVIMVTVVARMNEQTRASTEAGVMIGTAATSQSGEPLVRPEFNQDYPRSPREPGTAGQ